ncbi:PREDICTED: neurophysin 1-like [Nicrophorus vespilloides]|uniref:Neurophysin 1-like n=1 Tax=Nicrophorus vespilloides TaxID=110193 RepID=A0ABM1MTN3_NICVS|nr:PREDICTED: neurophysin 1-like [Nicrophorus vespilloides]
MHSPPSTMFILKSSALLLVLAVVFVGLCDSCLITNCPRGGKRAMQDNTQIKPCITCGPGRSGQCFGPGICCGPFGCLLGTQETVKCQREGFFHGREPCIAGSAPCRKNTGRCAAEGLCCSQESCHSDKSCTIGEAIFSDFYNLMNSEYAEN